MTTKNKPYLYENIFIIALAMLLSFTSCQSQTSKNIQVLEASAFAEKIKTLLTHKSLT